MECHKNASRRACNEINVYELKIKKKCIIYQATPRCVTEPRNSILFILVNAFSIVSGSLFFCLPAYDLCQFAFDDILLNKLHGETGKK